MKENARKILLLSYAESSAQPITLTYEHIKLFLPHLTGSGMRSLVVALKRQGCIDVERVMDETQIRLTNRGRQEVERAFPFLTLPPQSGTVPWATLIFINAPKSDKQFRYLRSLLVKYRAINLTRGVYLYPFAFPPAVIEECHTRYADSVVIGKLEKWLIGDDRRIAIDHFHILDLIQSYSGISKDLDRLIERKKVFRDLNHQEKKHLSSLFNRWYSNLQEDYGLIPVYFPHVSEGTLLLKRLQSLL